MDKLKPHIIPSIKIYQPDLGGWNDLSESLRTGIPKACRAGRIVEEIKCTERWEPLSVEEPDSFDMQRGLGPRLSQLPGEIRNIIYTYLFSTGHPQLLRASKALYFEGIGLMSNSGIYRMTFGFANPTNYNLPSQGVVDTIRNLEVRACLSFFGGCTCSTVRKPSHWLLKAFGEPGVTRAQCSVSLKVYDSTEETLVQDFCMPLRLFSDFETVIVRTEIVWYEPPTRGGHSRGTLVRKAARAWLKQRKTAAIPWTVFKCQFLHDLLLPLTWNLGKARCEEQNQTGFRLVFHPRKALEESGNL